MKKIIFTLSFFLIYLAIQAQQCNGLNQLVIRGAKNSGMFHHIQMGNNYPHIADASQTEIIAEAWTYNAIGQPICNFRAAIKYELGQIPRNAIITSAKLYLFARTNSTNAYVGHPTYGANNNVAIQRVTNDWDILGGTTYGWNDQTTTSKDSVVLPASTNDAQDYVAEIKNLVQFWVQNPDSNFGMQLKQIDENYYKSMIFHSGTSPVIQQPRLEICYFTEDNYPRVYGTAYYDVNGNGLYDSTEIAASYQKITLSNGSFTFTDANGYYELSAYPYGQYTVTATAPNFYTSSNLATTINFTGLGQIIPNNIGFTAISNTDSLTVKIIPFHRFARPGFNFPCYIEYENVGNTNLTPVSAFDYDSSKIIYDSCSNGSAINFGNFIGINASQLIKPGERHFYIAYLDTKTIAQFGDTVHQFANIYDGMATAYDTAHTLVSAAYDPNDIQATEQLTLDDVSSGKYIDYIIRFENIGNDTAINILIKDTLPATLKMNSLELVSSSHSCQLTVKDNILKASFKNIKLPYKSLNDLKCDGFVKFRVKPIDNIAAGSIIPNKASIYFDYSNPVVTNTAFTKIVNKVLPLLFTMYNVQCKNCDASSLEKIVMVNWNTSNEINVDHYIITRSIDGKVFKEIGKVKANNQSSNSYIYNDHILNNEKSEIYYYRIIGIDKDGSKVYSSIKNLNFKPQSSNLIVYPNPAKDILQISSSENLKEIIIIDNMGRIIKTVKANAASTIIDVKKLNKGIYILQTRFLNDITDYKKIIIE